MEIWQLILWAAMTVILIIVEIATIQLVAVWFAAGSFAAFIAALFVAPLWVQLVVFIVVSILLLLATRPFVRSLLQNRKKVATNADSLIGTICTVKETINNREDTGRVFADGLLWTARSTDGTVIEPDESCIIESIVGVKLIVRPVSKDSASTESI